MMADWTLICNNSVFDLESYFETHNEIVWKQLKSCAVGDYMFFYMSAPFSSIRYVCRVEEIDIRNPKRVLAFYLQSKYETPHGKETNCAYMRLHLIEKIECDELKRVKLIENGMNSFQKSCHAPEKLSTYLHKVLQNRGI